MQDGDFSNVKTSNLYHIAIPESYAGRKYSKLFDFLSTHKYMIPLGIYRTDKVNLDMNADEDKRSKRIFGKDSDKKFKEIKYVITNPSRDFRLQ